MNKNISIKGFNDIYFSLFFFASFQKIKDATFKISRSQSESPRWALQFSLRMAEYFLCCFFLHKLSSSVQWLDTMAGKVLRIVMAKRFLITFFLRKFIRSVLWLTTMAGMFLILLWRNA